MQQRQRLIESTNRGFVDFGHEAAPPGVRHEVEDRLIEVLEHCLTGPNPGQRSVNLRPFREWLRAYSQRAGWNPDNLVLCLNSDDDCEATIHFTIASLKRMSCRQEYSINWLLRHGMPHGMMPDGQTYLQR